jgi:hypothetical protein
VTLKQAGLAEEAHIKRQRLEKWLDEQVRSEGKIPTDKDFESIKARYRLQSEKLGAATFLNRLVVIKQLEAMGLSKPLLVTGGWNSPAYREFREFAPDLLKDETEGMGLLLSLLYDELALDLPGLFGRGGITDLFPIPASTLRVTIEALDQLELRDIWLDDTVLGWVYQFWNDPEREDLDTKLNQGGKVEPHEIASKTQMFTERYMVEWLLHNSLGQLWLGICRANDWQAEVISSGTLARLEERRSQWREWRESGKVALDALMPMETELEERWKYFVLAPQDGKELEISTVKSPSELGDLGGKSIVKSPSELEHLKNNSIRDLKILDPACGSGHFLVIAVGLLFALYQEEARHRQEVWTDEFIIKSILENNLYGLDIDPRAVQIAAAALWLKAKSFCPNFSLKSLNLVASNLNLAALAKDDPDLVALRRGVYEVTGIPENLTEKIIQSLRGADQWGSLLKVDEAVDRAISEFEANLGIKAAAVQTNMFEEVGSVQRALDFDAKRVKSSLLEMVESFLAKHTGGDDLGLRLRGQQLAAGVRFIRIIRENSYDLVIGNPPYQGSSKMADSKYLEKHYPKGKADLYSAFLERGLQLAKVGGLSALLTMRNWMFISQFSDIRQYLFDNFDLLLLGDLDRGAFTEILDEVVSTVMSIFYKNHSLDLQSIAIQPTPLDDKSRDSQRTSRKESAILLQIGRYKFHTDRFEVIKDKPLIYWWDEDFLKRYAETPKLGDLTEVRQGLATANNLRYLRRSWEVTLLSFDKRRFSELSSEPQHDLTWVPYIKGALGKLWFEPLDSLILWKNSALEKRLDYDYWGTKGGNGTPSRQYYFKQGVAFPKIGQDFVCRAFRYQSVFGDAGSSVFLEDVPLASCLMNSSLAQQILSSLNPTVNFQVGDVVRLPLFPIESADEIFAQLEIAFSQHEAVRETSVEFQQPGPTAWNYAQQWAQQAVDREPGTPLPPYQPIYQEPTPEQQLSYSIGLALGRFPLAPQPSEKSPSLPNGILYLSAYSPQNSLSHPASQIIQETWQQKAPPLKSSKGEQNLKKWLRENFFSDIHLKMYENRPIYFPLSSPKKNFVALISIHRWQNDTLQTLLADYLHPELTTMEGELKDLTEARSQSDKTQKAAAEKRYTEIQKLYDELQAFINLIAQIAEQGPPPANSKDQARETDARFQMNLDDGVMINSAALWSLLEPQWKQPKKWWSELCNAQGKGDYDWSHLAQHYFPDRVDQKCQKDPSLAVAHGVFWKYHPAKAYEWELRLQDEIGPDFTLDENHSDQYRQTFVEQHPQTVAELHAKEEKRRDRKYNKEKNLPLFAQ